MRLFSRLHKDQLPDPETIREIRDRVREMRQRLNRGDVQLAGLFALVREDERPIMRKVEAKQVGQERVRPDQVPAGPKPGGPASQPANFRAYR